MGRIKGALTHRSPLSRAFTATGIALALWLGAWTLSYLIVGEGVLTVPGKLAPRIDILWQHIGAREILAYLLVAAALANIHMWRPRRWHDMTLRRVRALADVRLRASELALVAGALAILAWTANVEAAGVIAFLK